MHWLLKELLFLAFLRFMWELGNCHNTGIFVRFVPYWVWGLEYKCLPLHRLHDLYRRLLCKTFGCRFDKHHIHGPNGDGQMVNHCSRPGCTGEMYVNRDGSKEIHVPSGRTKGWIHQDGRITNWYGKTISRTSPNPTFLSVP